MKTIGTVAVVILIIGSITRGAIVPRPMAQFLRDVVSVGLGGSDTGGEEWTPAQQQPYFYPQPQPQN